MKVEGKIEFGMEIRKVKKKEREKEIKKVEDMLKIGNMIERKKRKIQGGKRRRVEMGREIVRKKKVLMLDEKLYNIDEKMSVEMRKEIKRIKRRMKKKIVYVNNEKIEEMKIEKKIEVMKDGVIKKLGKKEEIYKNKENMLVEELMGQNEMKIMKVKVEKRGQDYEIMIDKGEGEVLKMKMKEVKKGIEKYVGKEVVLGIRKEEMKEKEGEERKEEQIVEGE